MILTDRQKDLEAQLTMWVLNENRRRESTVSLDELELKANELSAILTPELDEIEIEQVRLAVTHKANITQGLDIGIVDRTFRRWIAERKPSIEERRWNAYRGLLVSRGWAPSVIDALEHQTDDVVELMGDPTAPAPWARRGLLMGDVQSGKTATYIGVLNKAIDYGYRVIIILGGHTNDLRSQTQARVDHDLTGTNSTFLEDNIRGVGEQMRIGIGLVDHTFSTNGLTTVRRDFSASSKLAAIVWVDTGVPTVFVVKKNVRMLENVASYVRAQGGKNGFNLPLVVVDDEADWGSPNTADPDSDPTRVNKAIRKLLDVSTRSTYLGITATPFANVLIDHTVKDDLFPRDYIRALAAPSNYLGVKTYFDDDSDVVIGDVEDCLQILPLKHKKDHPVSGLPESLEDAITAFFIGTAMRMIRDSNPNPSSMMINVSRFNRVQGLVHQEVEAFATMLAEVITTEFARSSTSSRSPLASRIQDLAFHLFPEQMNIEFSWQELAEALPLVANSYRTELVNNQTARDRANSRRLMTPEQRLAHDIRPVIYVGGDVLSRGLTLDGLQVSYFVRQPGSADTLLQMGRWFGYRPGYQDLVRIWMPSNVVEIFGNVARISQELREDLREMQAHSLTPEQFGIKIRLIPEIAIVAANKQRAARVEEVDVNLHGQVKQSVNLSQEFRNRNALAVQELLGQLSRTAVSYVPNRQAFGWHDVPITEIVDFFERFSAHQSDLFFGTGQALPKPQIVKFLADAKNSNSWDVVVVAGSGDEVTVTVPNGPLLRFKSSVRNQLQVDRPVPGALHFKNQQVASPTDLANALDPDAYFELRNSEDLSKPLEERVAKNRITHPMLMLYAITTKYAPDRPLPGIEIGSEDPLWAVRVVFPSLNPGDPNDLVLQGRSRRILVNTVWQEQMFGIDADLDSDPFDEEVDG